jgi:PAS domain S-box-containing protein
MQSGEQAAPRLAVDLNPIAEQMAESIAAGSATAEVILDVPMDARSSLIAVCEALDHADTLAANGLMLQTPALPEIRGCRDWFFDQLLIQMEGGEPHPWVVNLGIDEVRSAAELDFGAVLDQLHDAIVVADDRNHIAYANAAVEQVLGWPPGDLAGRRLTTIIPQRLHEAHIAGYTRYLVTRQPRLIGQPVRVPARRRDGSEIEIELRLRGFRPAGARQMFLGVLRIPEPPAQRVQGHADPLTVLARLTDLVAAGSGSHARLLETLASSLGRRVAAWWEPRGEALRCVEAYQVASGGYDAFLDATMQRRFRRGEGLPGRVWEAGRPEWVPDVVADANFPRTALAVQHQLRVAVAIPVVRGEDVIGVIELFGDSVEAPDEQLLGALATVGRLLGITRS